MFCITLFIENRNHIFMYIRTYESYIQNVRKHTLRVSNFFSFSPFVCWLISVYTIYFTDILTGISNIAFPVCSNTFDVFKIIDNI